MKRAEWRPGREAGDLLPIRPIARRLRKADPASHLLHEGADTCRTLWLKLSDALVERAAVAQGFVIGIRGIQFQPRSGTLWRADVAHPASTAAPNSEG